MTFLHKILKEIDDLASYIKNDDTVLISVKNQKLLRTCFQLIVSLGISPCLVPGLGISLSKRSTLAAMLPATDLSDEQKYELLTECTDFFVRNYSIPVLKNIIISFHLSDYLAALIQLSFAPLKKPGVYTNFTMTQEMYDKLNLDRKKYIKVYDHLVSNCFQPILMKELLVLQNVTDKTPPAFVKRIITKELSRRLIAPGGLLSLIRCFMDSLEIDSGIEWKKIDIICKLIATKHGDICNDEYVQNICNQLKQILVLNNTKYLTTAIACLITLIEKYPESGAVTALTKDVFDSFNFENISESYLPGTIIFTTQQIEHKIQTYHSALSLSNQEIIIKLITPNIPVLFLIGMKCTNEGIKNKLNEILTKCMEKMDKNEIPAFLKLLLFGDTTLSKVTVEEFQAGLILKAINNNTYPLDDALFYFIELFKRTSDYNFNQAVLETSLQMVIDFSVKRNEVMEPLLAPEDEPILLSDLNRQYINILQLLSVISESSKINECLKKSPQTVFKFIEYFLQENKNNSECETIALILLNTILPNINDLKLTIRLKKLIPILEKISNDELNTNSILSNEAILLINGGRINKSNSPYEKAVSNAFDNLLPTRGHGIIELTKLIDKQDVETISKRHLEQLKDADSYIYLAAINGIASLAMHCSEDVLNVLCKEFLNISTTFGSIETREMQNKTQEMRLKIGDIIVKVTKRLGDMSIVHKTILLNTMLTACRDHDPLIRASALSNLAEIALVLHYRIGSIIYEVLLCIESIIETDRAMECRRAAVMVISSLLKGLGKETLIELKEHLLPLYRTLNKLYKDPNEDHAVKLHAQTALEELNDIVYQFLLPNIDLEKPFSLLDEPKEIIYK
ncbi:Transmembrane and coiled-coil domain-containing protein 7 [Papilio machaon]|uniref:Transmembrane and coiled-coil domain-containing protein 7 n=1 Tax=Papilio machaon TaxID=76193 RepID=A0A194QLJ5_PAPMA|nr:Transmembrane and coiled-coil domain-containing protein 7 [Papilio machaon]